MVAVLLLIVLVIVGLAVASWQATKAAQSRSLSALLRSLDGGRGRTEQGFFDGLESTWIQGSLKGRPVSLDFKPRGSSKYSDMVARYGVEVDNNAADFSLSKNEFVDQALQAIGLAGPPGVHEAIGKGVAVVEGWREGGAGRTLLQQVELVTRLRRLIDAGFTPVRLLGGRLVVEQRVGSLDLPWLLGLYAQLSEIAALCERRKVTVEVRGDSLKPRFAWTDGGAGLVCPYCRDEVQVEREGDDLTACDRCGTLHHRICFDEAGGCTIFGCRRDGRPVIVPTP